jgi:DNA-binding transcriptional ArsR family regulator
MDDDWVPLPGAPEMLDEVLLDDVKLIGELTHPLRSRILHRLRQPRSVAELATDLEVPVTRLYHHIKHLEESGFIGVVATRRAAIVTERRYRNLARDFTLDSSVLAATDPDTLAQSIGSVFDVARTEFQREVRSQTLIPNDLQGRAAINFSEFTLSDEHLVEFVAAMRGLLEKYSEFDTPDGTRFRLLVAGFPLTD